MRTPVDRSEEPWIHGTGEPFRKRLVRHSGLHFVFLLEWTAFTSILPIMASRPSSVEEIRESHVYVPAIIIKIPAVIRCRAFDHLLYALASNRELGILFSPQVDQLLSTIVSDRIGVSINFPSIVECKFSTFFLTSEVQN